MYPSPCERGSLVAPQPDRPSVLFVCVHDAGRSQTAAAWLLRLSGWAVEVRSAGSAPAASVNPAAVAAMLEVGVDKGTEVPKVLTHPPGDQVTGGVPALEPGRRPEHLTHSGHAGVGAAREPGGGGWVP
ncbi:MAG: hypothetical protein ABI249_06985 [Ornithinibacter sp.]